MTIMFRLPLEHHYRDWHEEFIPRGESMAEVIALMARDKIETLQSVVKTLPQVDVPLTHHFADHVNGREGVIPAGSVVVGRVHKQSQIQVVLSGSFSMFTDAGEVVRISAPAVYVSPAGLVRSMFYHEDTRMLTILGTDEKDPEVIYNTLTADNYDEFLEASKLALLYKEDWPCIYQPSHP